MFGLVFTWRTTQLFNRGSLRAVPTASGRVPGWMG